MATGKSTVTAFFKDLGAKVIDADRIAHSLITKNGECVKDVIKIFGQDVVKRGVVDRKMLAEIVFNDESKLKALEAIIHPCVHQKVKESLKIFFKRGYKGVVVLDVPLLFEANLHRYADWTVVVKTTKTIQIDRAVKKMGITKAEALKRIKKQMPLKEKIALSDFVINNSGRFKHTKKQVQQLWNEITKKVKS